MISQKTKLAEAIRYALSRWQGLTLFLARRADAVDAIAAELQQTGETVFRIGRIDAGERGCTVKGAAGSWSGRDDWAATHHA